MNKTKCFDKSEYSTTHPIYRCFRLQKQWCLCSALPILLACRQFCAPFCLKIRIKYKKQKTNPHSYKQIMSDITYSDQFVTALITGDCATAPLCLNAHETAVNNFFSFFGRDQSFLHLGAFGLTHSLTAQGQSCISLSMF